MKKIILLILVVGMLGWAVFDFAFSSNDNNADKNNSEVSSETNKQQDTDEENTIGLGIGDVAPDFQLKTLEGEQVALSDYRGSIVMINFWATWCPPCRAEMPDMETFHQDEDVVILAVNLTSEEENIKQIKDFVKKHSLTFPILLDQVTEVANTYGVQTIPNSFMIDKHGVIQFKTFGPLNYEQMVQEFKKIEQS